MVDCCCLTVGDGFHSNMAGPLLAPSRPTDGEEDTEEGGEATRMLETVTSAEDNTLGRAGDRQWLFSRRL